jgi:signal transduction histidine kinase
VERLRGSRSAAVELEASELRRIERDLHDGAQQRLVMLSIDLGLAADRLDRDPASARALVVEAQDQARQALAELRDLVRGIAPAILLDRGLVAALGAIAGRCPVPTVVQSTLPEGARLPDAMERTAYFVVAEALANVAKHASAGSCEIRCRAEARGLVVEVWDDGAGGARILPTGGLAGLAGRVEALDGSLEVESPPGGPTLVRAVIPPSAYVPR